MTFEERLAELGVDLSDLKRPLDYTDEQEIAALEAGAGEGMTPTQFILHLIDIIDRMETRLVNVTGERDWLKDIVTTLNICETCGATEDRCDSCMDWPQYKYSGVPEDWSVGDD